MPTYLVTWEIDIDADNPLDAAEQALEIQRDPESVATVFAIHDQETGKTWSIDIEGWSNTTTARET